MATSISRAIDVLEELSRRQGGATPADVARACDLSRPTIYRILGDLSSRGYVAKVGRGRYELGSRLLGLAAAVSNQMDILQPGRSELEFLAEASQETAHLGVLDQTDVLYVGKADSPKTVRMYSYVGMRIPAYATAMGKAILAFSPIDTVDAYLTRAEFLPRTNNTVKEAAELRTQLELVKTSGYAMDDRENDVDIRCVAAPILDHQSNVVGALSVSALEYRRSRAELVDQIAPMVVSAAGRASAAIGYLNDGES